MTATSQNACSYDEKALIFNKIEHLNAIAYEGRTNWTYSEVYAAMMYHYGSIRKWYDANAGQESVCPYSSNACCSSAGYRYYRNWNTPAPKQEFTRYFVHGAGCEFNQCGVFSRLQKELPGIVTIGYDSHETYQNSWSRLLGQINPASPGYLFIGESLGGFWAAQLARHFGAKCYLLNPVTDVPSQMAQFVGRQLQPGRPAITQANLNTFRAAPDPRPSLRSKVGLMLSHNDTTINADTTAAYYNGYSAFTDWCNDGHVITSDASFQLIRMHALIW